MALPMAMTMCLTNNNNTNIRLCSLLKSHEAEDFGFSVHCRRERPDRARSFVVCKVTARSPAERSGVRCGDHILEINRVSVFDEPYAAALKQLKEAQELASVTLLLAGAEVFTEHAAIELSRAQPADTVDVGEPPGETQCGKISLICLASEKGCCRIRNPRF